MATRPRIPADLPPVTRRAGVHPNHYPPPGPLGNTQGKIVPDTQPNPGGESAPPIKPTEKEKSWWQRWGSEFIHTGLDIIGLIPVAGELADGANALIYLAEGDTVNAAISAAAMVPGAGMAATGAKIGKKAAGAVAEGAAKKAEREAAEELAEKAQKEAAEKAEKEAIEKSTKKADGNSGGYDKGRKKRRPGRRCELVPYKELQCDEGQEAHHVVPDWMLRLGKRGGLERIPGMPSLEEGPAICLEKGGGKEHNTAHKHTDRPAARIGKSGRATGTPGTLRLGQAKAISSRAIEKATGGPGKGGCAREDIRRQLDEQFRAHNDAILRAVKDARKVTEEMIQAIKPNQTPMDK